MSIDTLVKTEPVNDHYDHYYHYVRRNGCWVSVAVTSKYIVGLVGLWQFSQLAKFVDPAQALETNNMSEPQTWLSNDELAQMVLNHFAIVKQDENSTD